MTPEDPQQNDRKPTDDEAVLEQDEQCLLYLLDELTPASRRRFEARLATDRKLGDELIRQADLIATLSQTSPLGDAAIEPPRRDTRRWRWVAALVSLAASIALGFQIARIAPPTHSLASRDNLSDADRRLQPTNESALFAEAWASSQTIGKSSQDSLAEAAIEDPFDPVPEEPSSDMDSQVSWMFVAIASSDEMQTEGGNDG